MADKIYKNIDSVLEKEYKDLSDEAIDKFGKGEKLDPEKQKRYDQVKGEISKQVKNPYYGKSAAELDKEGFNGWHNVIVDKLNSSYYDTFDEFQEDLERGWDGEPWDEKQKQYLDAYARQVFGVDPEE